MIEKTTRIVFTGSRQFEDTGDLIELMVGAIGLKEDVEWGFDLQIQHGGAVGFDTAIHEWLKSLNINMSVEIVRPEYGKGNDKYAPIMRNEKMVDWAAEAQWSYVCAALPKGAPLDSGGTARTIQYALKKNIDAVQIWRF